MDNDKKAGGHSSLLIRSAEILGGEQALRAFLRVSPDQLQRWMTGRSMLPTSLFLKLADLLAEHNEEFVSRLRSNRHELQQKRGPLEDLKKLREAARGARLRSNKALQRSILLRSTRLPERAVLAASTLRHRLFDPAFVPADRTELLETALDATLAFAGTELGHVQLLDEDGALRIAAQRGFGEPFLDFFAVVSEPESACGVAMSIGRQVSIPNVLVHPLYAGTVAGKAMESAGCAAVTSSPLVHESGLVMGMISTHFRVPGAPEPAALASLDLIARRAASWLDASPTA